ncbi:MULTISPECIES: peptide ABC transporter substrate-binding protein [unclassified Shinella]|uniref:peptide ABC transporter substrate-binding protein n=1 Tax=unclassified Shinella TaxID=2643062 RepID=UPI00225D1AC5|nr:MULTISPECIES: peptide ABC transporter substrate-binding protein [unclassified Shinella]MCO5139204.1 peptide ABC transporter substrate-binding protein [Shinella sp.]MDC7256066.1 peptide ABC transporter substrate-binding protein [Shinella sp. YE25]CAI0338905.1 Peptide ABC transporter substrate-binding protein [Rhizobiaceae bacterium]CAK7257331.1 peptide/nickel transport system substrate-binding protein [Shinella sp. WSC3-e]
MSERDFQFTRRQSLKFFGAAGLAVMAPSVLGMGAARAQDTPKGQIVVGFSQEPTVFNPHLLHIEVDEGVHFAIFDPLFDVDAKGNFYPLLAKEVPTVENGGVSADGLTWKVTLRDDVTWHDGTPFTAEDVKFTLELLVNPDFRSWRRTGHSLVRDITVVSPTEISWRMESAFAPYTAILASTFIVPKHGFEGADPNNAPFNNAPIGTGAYKWKQRVAGDHIELEANPGYFGDGPYLERLVLKYIPDITVLYTQLKTGDIDVLALQWISPDNYEEAKTLPDRVVEVFGAPFFEGLSFNLQRPQFKERAVREALYYAVDKQTIIDALYYGVPQATESYMPRESYYYNANLPVQEYNLDKARALLDEAGWKPGSDGIREKDGVRLAFTCSTTSGNHLREQAQQFLQQSFREIGVDMQIGNLPPAVMWGDHWMLSQFDMALAGLSCLTGPDPDTSDYFLSTSSPAKGGNGQNTWVYENPEVDELLKKGGALVSPEERLPIYQRIQEIMRQDLPFLPIFQYANIRGYKTGIQGVEANINNRIDTWNVRSWRWA